MADILSTFIKGLLFGITLAAIPGPIFFLIIQRTLSEGILTGICCNMGAILGHATFMMIAAVGLSFVTQFLLAYQHALALMGGLFLIYLGITTYRRIPVFHTVAVANSSYLAAGISTFLLTIANPVTIISYGVIFAGLALDSGSPNSNTLYAMVGGVLIGATCVDATLLACLAYFHHRISPPVLQVINKIAGVALMGFGAMSVVRCIKHLMLL